MKFVFENKKMFVRETSRYFEDKQGESLVSYFESENYLIVLSSKRMFIYFCDKYIDVDSDIDQNITQNS